MDKYSNPLEERYASKEMLYIFSPDYKFKTWRKLWILLAKTEKKLGLDIITDEQIKELEKYKNDINIEVAKEYEKKIKHDVMSHILAFGEQAKISKPIIHLGATSAYVGDNTDLIQIKNALVLTQKRLITIIEKLSKFAMKYKDLPTLGFTHFQSAQLTTVGKRATMWLQSIITDFKEVVYRLNNLEFLGVKGTTGTQASFRELFNDDYEKVKELDSIISRELGFKNTQAVSGQTYDRKTDSIILNTLSNIAESAHKFTNDLRLLQHLKEIEEPFENSQVGSSAMAYKRNPIRSERIASLSKFVISLSYNGKMIAMTQWFERTLDDSANKRLSMPQAFLAIDSILLIWSNILDNIVVYDKVIEANVKRELPFMATENIIMSSVKKGLDRQVVHEVIRELSMEVAREIKLEGKENTLIEKLLSSKELNLKEEELTDILNSKNFIGFADKQTESFINNTVEPLLKEYRDYIITEKTELKV